MNQWASSTRMLMAVLFIGQKQKQETILKPQNRGFVK